MQGDDPTMEDLAVLLVEDDDDDAFFIKREFEAGVEHAFVDEIDVTRVASLAAAIERCEERTFDAVFLDLGLPDSRGVETLSRFTDQAFGLPVIVLTGLQDSRTALEAIQRGAQDYLVKDETSPKTVVKTMRHAIERKANEQKIRRQRDQMEFFNSILRHDMLNGLQVIQGRAQALERELEGEEKRDVEKIGHWSDNIVDLTVKIRDILDAVTSEDGAELSPVDLADVVDRHKRDVAGMREGVTVETENLDGLEVQANELLGDVLKNLLTNAVEHTRPDPVTIRVSAEDGDTTTRIVVEDDGPGIPESAAGRLFERGEKGDSSGGTGFGLFFVASMMDTYGGDVWVDQKATGARFVLEFPDR